MIQPEPPELEDFSPQKFVKGLSSGHLEILSEFFDEAEEALGILTSAGRDFKAPTGLEMLQVFKAAEEELADRFSPQVEQLPLRRSTPLPPLLADEEPGHRPGTSDHEWLIELRDEVIDPPDRGPTQRRGQRLPFVASPAEVQRILDATKDHQRNHLVIRVLYAAGLRREETINIRVADLYLDRNTIFIRYGKGDKDRYVLIDDETSRLLREYTRNFLLSDPVFDISTRTVNRIVEDAAQRSGVQERFLAADRKFTVHSLRHCYATHMYEGGADIFALKVLLGHLFLRVTQTYVNAGVQTLADGYRAAHPFCQQQDPPSPDQEN